MKKKNNKGFTLVELLVVIAIIGILAVVAVPALFKNINKAKVADLEADYNAIKSAALSYYTDNNKYPGEYNNDGSYKGEDIVSKAEGFKEYMDTVPTQPSVSTKSTENNGYQFVPGTKGELILKVNNVKIDENQAKKLNEDLGSSIVGGSLDGDSKEIKLVLLKSE